MKLGLWGVLATGALLSVPASAQSPRSIYFYNSALGPAPQGMNLAQPAGWGNGSARNSRTVDFEGAPVLEITTRNFNEGARFDLKTPLDITPYQENGFVRFRMRFREGGPPQAPGMMGGPGGMEGGPPPGGFPGGFQGGFPGGFQPGGMPQGQPQGNFNNGGQEGFIPPTLLPQWRVNRQIGGGALPPLGGPGGGFMPLPEGGEGGMPGGQPMSSQYTPIRKLQVTMMRENGATAGRITVNPETLAADEDGWHLFVLPISEMRSTTNASGPVQRVIVTADKQDTFYVAQAALVIESPQIQVAIRQANEPAGTQQAEITVKPGPITLIADVEAGAADPAIEWNFDADNVGNLPAAMFGGGPPPPGGAGGDVMMEPAMQPAPGRPIPGQAPATRELIRRPAAPPEVLGGGEGAPQFGPRVDSRGLVANFTYPNEEQNYRVQVTVRDRSGVKQPVTASILVRVRG